MTDKNLVQRKYPNAYAYKWADGWTIYLDDVLARSFGSSSRTAAQAWTYARKELRLRKRHDDIHSGG